VKGLLIVVVTAILAWIVVAGPAALMTNEGPEVTVPALLVCLVPNLVALIVAGLVRPRGPAVLTGVLLASFLIRPFVSIALGFGLYAVLPRLHGRELSLLVWGALFYIILLGAESIVVSRQVAGSNASR
jgi:hypothetical protein